MAKTKGIRKAKHGKRHSRKKHGGEIFQTMDDIINKKKELEKELEDRNNNLKKLEVLQYLKIYSELKPRISEGLFKMTNKVAYGEFDRYRNNIDKNDHNPIANYKTLSKPDLNEKIKSLENELRDKVGNKEKEDIEKELNTLKTTCPTKVNVDVEKKNSENITTRYTTTFQNTTEDSIKSEGDFKCNANGPGEIIVKDKNATDNGELRTVDAVNGIVPLNIETQKLFQINYKPNGQEEKKEKVPEWKEEPGIVPDHAFTPDVERSVEIKREKAERKFLKTWTDSPAYKLDDGSPNWKKIYEFFNSRDMVKPIVLTDEYKKFMEDRCSHDQYSMQAIENIDCKLDTPKKKNIKKKMLLAIHPDKNPGKCYEVATDKMKKLNEKCDQKGGKKSKKTQRKRKRKHRASSRH